MKRSFGIGLMAVGIMLHARGTAEASRLFFSTSADAPTEVAGQVDPSITVAQNSTVSLYLWWQPSGQDQLYGLGHSVQLSNPILTQVSYTIDNPTVSGQPRWNSPTDAGQTSAASLVENAGAFNLNGSTFGSGGSADPFYDPASGTYRFSTVQFKATTVGATTLNLGVGQQGIAFVGQPDDTLVNFGFGDGGVAGNDFGATSSLGDATVTVVAPDPTKPWQNPVIAADVNGDSQVTPIDALVIINELNANGAHALTVPPPASGGPPPYLDPNGDNILQAVDALVVINYLDTQQENSSVAVEAYAAAVAVPEPSAGILALWGIGLLALARRARRSVRDRS